MYQTTRVSIHVFGDVNQIVTFMDLMEAAATSSMAIDDIDVKWADNHWDVSLDVLAYTVAKLAIDPRQHIPSLQKCLRTLFCRRLLV